MQKVLLISYYSCYPLNHGGAIAQYYFIDGLKNKIQFILCTEIQNEKDLKNLEQLEQMQPELKVFALNSIQPLPHKSKLRFLKKILKQLFNFLLHNEKPDPNIQPNSDDFDDPYFAHVDNQHSEKFVKLINEVILKEDIKQVQFDFYNTLDLCWAIPENVRKILIHHEIRFKRLQLAYNKSKLSTTFKNYLIQKTELYERACIREMDQVVVFNENDAELIRKDCKKITVSPFGIPDELIFRTKTSDTFNKLLFVGGEGHTPNLLGLTWFLDNIYIPNKERINLPVWIIGLWSDNLKNKYKAYSQIVFCGMVNSIEPYFDNSVFINPIFTGAGLRTKVLHAFVNKVPVLSTNFGAEGCYSDNDKSHLGLFENADEFLTIMNSTKINCFGELGFKFYSKHFNNEELLNIRFNIYE